MKLKILGPGCTKCKTLYERTSEVIEENNINATIEKVEDIEQIMAYNVMNTPALVLDEKVVLKGRVPVKRELLELLMSGNELNEDNSSTCPCGGKC